MAEDLKRSLSLTGCVAVIVGLVIGPSIFVVIPSLAAMTGPSLYLAYLISVIPAIFTGLYLMQLGGALPVTGSNYVAVTRWISPNAGFILSFAVVIAIVSTNCLVAWGFAQYLGVYIQNISHLAIALVIIILFGFINWIGIKIFEVAQVLMMVVFIIAMLIFGLSGMANIQPEYTAPLFPKGMGSFFLVIVIATFSWAGFVSITEVAGEIKNPRRNIPLSIIISIVIILILYVLQTYVLTGTLLWSKAGEIGPTAVLVAAKSFLPGWLVAYVAFAALLAMATTINAITLIAAREMYAWSRDHILPSVFNKLHPRFYTPGGTILLVVIFSIAGTLFAADLDKYALMVVFALMIIQIFGATATWLMPKKAPELYEKSQIKFSPFWRWFTWLGCIICFTFIFLFGFLADWKTGLIFIGIMLIGVVYWFIRKTQLERNGISLEEELKEFSTGVLAELEDSN